MSIISAEQLAQRIFECNLLEQKAINEVLSSVGGRTADLEDFRRALESKGLLTNWQTTRLIEGQRKGFFYESWKILYLVGAGTFARVYRGVHIKTGEVKAIKVLRNRYCNDLAKVEDFIREAQTVMALRHPNIVPIHEVETFRGRSYMVMDFIEGQNLRDFVKTHGQLKLMTALNIAHDLASGLEYAGTRGITHRDMKLSNVLLSSKGQAKLVDFGLATINTGEGDEDFTARSIDYAGLEKLTGVRRNDSRSDIYFLGCMLYHMLAGEPPLFETRERIKRLSPTRYREIKPLTSLASHLPNRVVILTNRLMELKPEKRVQTPAQAVKEIDSVIDAIKKGKTEKYDEQLAQQHAAEYAELMEKRQEGDGRTVMVIESDNKLQDLLRSKLKELGYRVLVIGNPQTAINRFSDLDPAEDRPADCVVFGCKGLSKNGLIAFNQFAEHEYTESIPAILLLAEGQEVFKDHATLSDNRLCLHFPLKFKQIRKALLKLISRGNDSSVAS
jgi:serine/threonine protein kinase